MSRRGKTIITTTLLVLAFIQGPVLYYFASGFVKLIFLVPVACMGLWFSVLLTIRIIKFRYSNTAYHIVGLIVSVIIGATTLTGTGMEYLDFWLRLDDRNRIVEGFKNGKLRTIHLGDDLFPLSNDGDNSVDIWKDNKGAVSIGFFTNRGFLGDTSLFLYTNDPVQIKDFNDKMRYGNSDTTVKQMAQNWYRVGY